MPRQQVKIVRPNSAAGPLPIRVLGHRIPLPEGSVKMQQEFDFTQILDARGGLF